jgi:heptose I phosphotransferase
VAHLELHRELQALFPEPDPFSRILALDGELFRQFAARRTLKVELLGNSYFIKIHLGVGWKEILKNLLYLRRPVLGARDEWAAIKRLEELGVPTMKIAGFGERGINPARRQSFLITEELCHTVSLEDFCRDWGTNPPLPALKRALIDKVAAIARQLHANGVNHRDFYLCHFLLDRTSLAESADFQGVRLYLIDLHRVQIRDKTPRRWVIKDLAGLYFSSMDIGLTQRDLLRFMRAYRQKDVVGILGCEAGFWNCVRDRAEKLYRKHFGEGSGGAAAAGGRRGL